MIESWIDNLCKVWEINTGLGMVRSYKLLAKAEFPSAINPQDLLQNPVALTIPASVQPYYSKGRKHLTWYGVTEFHIAPDLDRARLPELIPWYGRILRAAAASVQLSATVANFVIMDRVDGIEGPVALRYGDETAHWGFLVRWMVEECPTSTDLPVTA